MVDHDFRCLLHCNRMLCFEVELPLATIRATGAGAQRVLGAAPWGSCVGRSLFHLVHPCDAEKLYQIFETNEQATMRGLACVRLICFEMHNHLRTCTYQSFEVRLHALPGSKVGVFSAEQIVEESGSRLLQLFQHAPGLENSQEGEEAHEIPLMSDDRIFTDALTPEDDLDLDTSGGLSFERHDAADTSRIHCTGAMACSPKAEDGRAIKLEQRIMLLDRLRRYNGIYQPDPSSSTTSLGEVRQSFSTLHLRPDNGQASDGPQNFSRRQGPILIPTGFLSEGQWSFVTMWTRLKRQTIMCSVMLLNLVLTVVQVHIEFILDEEDCVANRMHLRLCLPTALGGFQTSWRCVGCLRLDGSALPIQEGGAFFGDESKVVCDHACVEVGMQEEISIVKFVSFQQRGAARQGGSAERMCRMEPAGRRDLYPHVLIRYTDSDLIQTGFAPRIGLYELRYKRVGQVDRALCAPVGVEKSDSDGIISMGAWN